MSPRQILLIRHAQASFSATDYDQLSELGVRQAQQLGAWFKDCGQVPQLVVQGSLRRHKQTADRCLAAAAIDVPRLELRALDELDHGELLARHRPDLPDAEAVRAELRREAHPHRAFQALFAAAVRRWMSGEHDGDYQRSWPQFRAEVLAVVAQLNARTETTIWAFTSGGPIAVIVNSLLQAPLGQTFELSWPLVNTSLSRVALSSQGAQLVSYNNWPHLERASDAGLLTYR